MKGLKTLMSKNVQLRSLPQNSSAATSRRAPSSVFADLSISCSPVMVVEVVPTLWQTFVLSSEVVPIIIIIIILLYSTD